MALTTKQVMGRDVKSMVGAWEVWDQLWGSLKRWHSDTSRMPRGRRWG